MTNVKTTTQTQHPWRATVRTLFQLLPAVAVLVPAVLEAVSNGNPDALPAWSAVALSVSAAVTRVMANPAVEQFLETWLPFLAAEPRPLEWSGVEVPGGAEDIPEGYEDGDPEDV